MACSLDVDGNGLIEPDKDGVLILRRLLGYTGDALIAGAVGAGACRSSAHDGAGFIDAQQLDVDQSGGLRPINALTDGLILLRTMLGLSDTAVTAGVTSQSWANVRNHLKTSCGMNLL